MQCFDTYYLRNKARRKKKHSIYVILIVWAVIFAGMVAGSCDRREKEQNLKNFLEQYVVCSHKHLTYKEWKITQYTEYFKKNGSKSPHHMAKAVMHTKKPKIMARIAVVESNGNPHLRKYGYKKAHDGAFGINRRYWGAVSKDPVQQAIQAEKALDSFLKEYKGDFIAAANNYGGDSTNNYSRKLLAKLGEVP